MPGPPDAVLTAVFLGDTTTVRVTSSDGSIYTWNTHPASWVEFACDVAGRNLTPEEWREAFGDRAYRETCP